MTTITEKLKAGGVITTGGSTVYAGSGLSTDPGMYVTYSDATGGITLEAKYIDLEAVMAMYSLAEKLKIYTKEDFNKVFGELFDE